MAGKRARLTWVRLGMTASTQHPGPVTQRQDQDSGLRTQDSDSGQLSAVCINEDIAQIGGRWIETWPGAVRGTEPGQGR